MLVLLMVHFHNLIQMQEILSNVGSNIKNAFQISWNMNPFWRNPENVEVSHGKPMVNSLGNVFCLTQHFQQDVVYVSVNKFGP